MSQVTLKDIAGETGFSFSLVSKVLRNSNINNISSETIQTIRDTAKKMGYIVNKSARALKNGKTNLIAVVLPVGINIASSIYPIITEAIVTAESQDDCKQDFVFFHTLGGYREFEHLQDIIALNPDGIIYSVPPNSAYGLSQDIERQKVLCNFVSNGKSLLFLLEKYNVLNSCLYSFDEVAGGYSGTKYLIDKGYKRILFCRAKGFDERMSGFINAMSEHGLAYTGGITDQGFLFEQGYHFLKELYQNTEHKLLPEAIFATCDIFAMGILKAMNELNLTRSDIEIMGYDGLEISDFFCYTFPTVVQPVREISHQATIAIQNWVESGIKPENKVFKPSIKIIGQQ